MNLFIFNRSGTSEDFTNKDRQLEAVAKLFEEDEAFRSEKIEKKVADKAQEADKRAAGAVIRKNALETMGGKRTHDATGKFSSLGWEFLKIFFK